MKTLMTAVIAAMVMALSGAGHAETCGRVTIANMNWQSAEVLAHIDQIILNEGYGCDAELVPGDTVPTFTSMNEKGEPDMAPELWLNSIREPLQTALDEGRLVKASPALSDGGVEGWWIPKYVADAHPDITTINDTLEHPELFPAPEDESMGAVHNCPAGWACEILTANLFRGFDAEEKGFVLVDTGSAAGLDGSIARAYEREEGDVNRGRVIQVATIMTPLTRRTRPEGPAIEAGAPLEDAARMMTDDGCAVAHVVNEKGKPTGVLTLPNVIEAMVTPPTHEETAESRDAAE